MGRRRRQAKKRRTRRLSPRQVVVQGARQVAEGKWASVKALEAALKEGDLDHPDQRVQCWGCKSAGCCKQLALATTFEGVILADRLQRDDPVRLGRIIEQGRRQWERWGKHGLAEMAAKDATCGWWFNQDELCALHDPDIGCTVYSDRPMTCASYYVVSPPSRCEPPSGTRVGAVNNAQQMLDVMLADLQFLGQDNDPRPSMPIGVTIAFAVEMFRRLR